ncbi:S-layer family protein [Marinobacterium sp. xm-m-312]|uniref:beta strand repeat-containing protein n=1 Tax=Marinobacterium sp. xm-m-312 TaxID=2497741 RepID=UPI001568379A|nr:retention module-containing protein [Marinobacterium sp. xm-m-312]NRQ24257.1 Poly(beta-D-mannuronate) C5 epimerase 7 [Marinobacterium sp. xm-m-312]
MANPVIATVQSVTAPITVRDEAGALRQVTTGDQLRLGEVVLTENGQSANILMTDGTAATLTGAKETLISNDLMSETASTAGEAAISEASLDQLINEISDQVTTNTPEAEQILAALQGEGTLDDVLEETAAGLTGEGEGEGHSFVILDRVDEQIDLALTTTTPFIAAEDQEPFEGVQIASLNLDANAPVAEAVENTGAEDAESISITLKGSDVDVNDSVESFTLSGLPTNGKLYTDANLTTLAEVDTSYAASSEELTLYFVPNADWNGETTFDYTANDGELDSLAATAKIIVTPVNDAPEFTPGDTTIGDDAGVVQENVTLTTSGTLSITDADAGEETFQPETDKAGTYGSLTLSANGNWTYTLDNANADVQALSAGDELSESFDVVSVDGSVTQVAITIQGTNDVPALTGDTGSVTEDTTLSTSGNVTIADTDTGESSFAPQASTAGTYGTFTLAADGAWSYDLDNANGDVQALGAGDSLTESFTVTSADGTATETVTITINGTNDVPSITSDAQNGAVKEDVTLTATGMVTSHDVDDSATATFSGDATGNYGSFVVDAETGEWTYTFDNEQSLAEGEEHTETFTVTVTDDQGATTTQDVTITVTGTNDAPIIANDTDWILEGSNSGYTLGRAGGNVLESLDQSFGAPSGTFATVADSDIDNDTTLTITAIEGSEVAAGSDIHDDNGTSVDGKYGTLVMYSNGEYRYFLDNSNATVDGLTADDTLTDEVFTYTVSDGIDTSTATLTMTIFGSNDLPTVTGDSGSVTEDTMLSTSGSVTIDDPDAGESNFVPQPSTAGTYGTFTLAADGDWSYDVDNANGDVQALGAGDTLTESFTVTSADGTATETVTITINGTNDAATITTTDSAVTENDTLTTLTDSGTLTVVDPDQGESGVASVEMTGRVNSNTDDAGTAELGGLTVNANGTYTFNVANAAVNYLATGETITQTYTVTTTDGSTETFDVVITGTNDAATVGDASKDLDETDVALTTSGTISISDADDGEAQVQAFTNAAGDNGYGTFTVDADGNWSFTANSAFDELNAGDEITDTITVTSADGTDTGVITVKITGTNDAATVGDASKDLDETDVALTTSGTISISDADDGEAQVQAFTNAAGDNGYGTFTVDADGNWSFTANSAFDELNAGDEITDTITVTSADGTDTGVITVKITGTNDAATITTTDSAVTENDALTTLTDSGTLTVVDPDQGESGVASVEMTGRVNSNTADAGTAELGGVTVNTDGTYTFNVANADVNYLAAGETITQTYTVTTTDGSTETFDVVITGTNDGPVAVNDDLGVIRDDSTSTFSFAELLANDSDPDGDVLTITGISNVVGGTATLVDTDSDGTLDSVSFVPTDISADAPGSFDYTISDGNGGTDSATANFVINDIPITYTGDAAWQMKAAGNKSSYDLKPKISNGESITFSPNGDIYWDLVVSGTNVDINDISVSGLSASGFVSNTKIIAENGSNTIVRVYIINGNDTAQDADNSGSFQFSIDFANGSGLSTTNVMLVSSDTYVVAHNDGSNLYDIDENPQLLSDLESIDIYYDESGVSNTMDYSGSVDDIIILARNGSDVIKGGSGDDVLLGERDNDQLYGGLGDDVLTGNSGDDVFAWNLADSDPNNPSSDVITDFGTGNDAIDISDLLGNMTDGADITSFISVTEDSGSTVVKISTSGDLDTSYDQQITLNSVDITGGETDQATLIQDLLNSGKLIID